MNPPAFFGSARAPTTPDVSLDLWVLPHALERLRLHHPNVGVRGALALLGRAEEIPPGVAAPLLGRSLEGVRDRYFLAHDRAGVYVIARSYPGSSFGWVMMTYLRFGPYQQDVAVSLYGIAA
ncbi:MAG: hypothetical protein V4850_34970 [Myxococcota bacterium]